jgi:hypothetical protein
MTTDAFNQMKIFKYWEPEVKWQQVCETVHSTVSQCVCVCVCVCACACVGVCVCVFLMAGQLEFGYKKPCSHCLPACLLLQITTVITHIITGLQPMQSQTLWFQSTVIHPTKVSFPNGQYQPEVTAAANSLAMYFVHRNVNLHSVQVLVLRNVVGF